MLKQIFARLFGKHKKFLPVVPVVRVSDSPDKADVTQRARAALDRAQRMQNERMDRVLLRKPPSGSTRKREESRRMQKSSEQGDGLMGFTMMGHGGVFGGDAGHRSGAGKSYFTENGHSSHSSHTKITSCDDSGFGGDGGGGCDGGGGGGGD